MIRMGLLALLATLPLPGGEGLVRSGPEPLAYDLGAERPWMPLLWHHAALVLPGDAPAQVQLIASFESGADGTDLLALRDGPRLTLTATGGLIDATSACTWSGVAMGGGGALTATTSTAVTADRALAMIRQIHYANLGGLRPVPQRRVRLEVRTLGPTGRLIGTALIIGIAPADAATPPILRFDPISIDTGGSAAWAPTACHASRGPLGAVRWRLSGSPGLRITGIDGGQRLDLRPHLAVGNFDLDAFAALALRIEASATPWSGTIQVTMDNGLAGQDMSWSAVSVRDPGDGLRVIGDPPFAVGPDATEFTLLTDNSAATLLRCAPHPGEDAGPDRQHFRVLESGLRLRLQVDPDDHPGIDLLQGEMVIGTGAAEVRLPYRILLRHRIGA